MYQKIKHVIWTFIFLVLWGRFFLLIADPSYGGFSVTEGLSIYKDWRVFIDWVYFLGAYIMMPVYAIYGFFAPIVQKIPLISEYFPFCYSSKALSTIQQLLIKIPATQSFEKLSLESPFVTRTFKGYIDSLLPFGLMFYAILSPIVDKLTDFAQNVLWNVLIEFSFTKRKEGKYQEALEKRAADLMKLNVEYHNLSKEANILAVSVVTDELTKVYNKRFFIEKINFCFDQARKNKESLAIAMVDIDHFKKLNDNYGHLLGDKVLQAVAQVAKKSTPSDCFCCRFGGEEFAIIMPKKSTEDVLKIIGQIHTSLPLLRFQEDAALRTSASFGICIADFEKPETLQAITSFEEFIKKADDELYRAKLNGRNRIEQCLLT